MEANHKKETQLCAECEEVDYICDVCAEEDGAAELANNASAEDDYNSEAGTYDNHNPVVDTACESRAYCKWFDQAGTAGYEQGVEDVGADEIAD